MFSLDTGRLHAETLRFIDSVRKHYGIEISVTAPDTVPLEGLVRKKGLFSFYDDGHPECCGIRKVAPLRRVLTRYALLDHRAAPRPEPARAPTCRSCSSTPITASTVASSK